MTTRFLHTPKMSFSPLDSFKFIHIQFKMFEEMVKLGHDNVYEMGRYMIDISVREYSLTSCTGTEKCECTGGHARQNCETSTKALSLQYSSVVCYASIHIRV